MSKPDFTYSTVLTALRLIRLLERSSMTAGQMSQALGISKRDVYRFLATLKVARVGIKKDSHNCKYYIFNS
jgi:DNA-binding IclR family transcriptional regulator